MLYECCRFDLGSNTISFMVNGVANQYSTREMLDEVSFQNKSQLQTLLHLFSVDLGCSDLKLISDIGPILAKK